MTGNAHSGTARFAAWTLALFVLAGATGAAFAGWIEHGAGILQAMAQSGMSWCF